MSIQLSISAQNIFTNPEIIEGPFNASIQGSFSGTKVTVQRSTNQTDWYDVDEFTAAGEWPGFEPERIWYRIGVKSGNYSTGPVLVRLGANRRNAI
jgi:hypothetical protein